MTSAIDDDYLITNFNANTQTLKIQRRDGKIVNVCIRDIDYRSPVDGHHWFEPSTGDVVLADHRGTRRAIGSDTGSLLFRCSQAQFDKWNARQPKRGDDDAIIGCTYVYETVMK